MTRDTVTLEDLRQRMNDLDRQLIELVAERKLLSEEVARVKRATGKPTRDYEREREVIMGVRAAAAERGVSGELAERRGEHDVVMLQIGVAPVLDARYAGGRFGRVSDLDGEPLGGEKVHEPAADLAGSADDECTPPAARTMCDDARLLLRGER